MSPVKKFLFDREFESGFDDPDVDLAPPEPTFTESDLAAARRAGYEEGYAAKLQEKELEQQEIHNALLSNVNQKITDALGVLQSILRKQHQEVTDIALAITNKLLPTYIQRHGFDEINILLENVIKELSSEPRFIVHVHENFFDTTKNLVESITVKTAYDGQVVVLADPQLHESDCRVEWSSGGIERDIKKFFDELNQLGSSSKMLELEEVTTNETNSDTDQ